MYGRFGKILRINLSSKKYEYIQLPLEVCHKYIGGKGLAGYFLKEHITRDYTDPEMPLLLFTGPLGNTQAPTSGRMTVMSRSPLTGTVCDTSVGGSLGIHIKRTGIDGIIITGKSNALTGLEITDDVIIFKECPELAGVTLGVINKKLAGKGAMAATGPAACNGVLYANLVVDNHYYAGRGGLGLVFAAKNLKYLTVQGTGKVRVHSPELLKQAREEILRLAAASPVLLGELGITHYGTGALYDLMDARRMMPTDNFRKTHFDAAKNMNAFAYEQKYSPKKKGCHGCTIQCKKITKQGTSLPEFETMSHFSALLENTDISIVTEANRICSEMGMDTISAGSTLACYQEITGKKLTKHEILSLLEAIGKGEGIGNELGQGSVRYAGTHGKPEAAMAVKSMELPAYDPRGAYGMALAYATSTRGGCHLRAYPISHEILRKPVVTDRFTFSGKARIIHIAENLNAVIDSLTACKFIFFAASLEEYAKAYTAVTGIDTSAQDLLKAGRRIYYNDRIMNALNGFSAKDDDLPQRFFTEYGSSGNNIEVKPIKREDFLETRANYYKICGLDENGMPTAETAEELGLSWKH